MQRRLARPRGLCFLYGFLVLPFLALVLVACGGDEDDEPADATATPSGPVVTATIRPDTTLTSSPAATSTPRPAASGTPVPGAGAEYTGYNIVGGFTYGEPVDFPENLLILVETGCTQCDGPTEALYRVWRNSGETHVELLVDASISGSEDAYITSFAVRPDLSDIVVTVCTECADAESLIDSSVTVYRSLDGGITWRSIFAAARGQAIYAQAIADEGIVFSNIDGELFYLRGVTIAPPEGAGQLLHDSTRAGELRWLAEDGSTVVDAQGVAIAVVEPGSLIDTVVKDGFDSTRTVVGWALDYVRGPFAGWVVTRTGPDGKLTGFRSDTYLAPVRVLDDGSILGSISTADNGFGGAIGFIDVLKGTLTPIRGALVEAPFGDGDEPVGRNNPQGAVSGPFLRVTTGVNCLPIRVSTEVRSRELTCVADGTLVYDLRNTTTVGGQQWSRVRLLDGREGFTVSSYLTAE